MITKMKKLNAGGFSLVELMVVVAIIGILSAVAIPNFQRFQRKARQSEAKSLLGGISTSEEAFRSEWETYRGSFMDIGFAPTGNLRYNVGFGAEAAALPGDPNFMANAITNFATSGGGCAAFATCTDISMNSNVAAVATGTLPAMGLVTPTAAAFGAGAGGNIGSSTVAQDEWTIDQLKNLTNQVDGTL